MGCDMFGYIAKYHIDSNTYSYEKAFTPPGAWNDIPSGDIYLHIYNGRLYISFKNSNNFLYIYDLTTTMFSYVY